jgi:hypothetical protein
LTGKENIKTKILPALIKQYLRGRFGWRPTVGFDIKGLNNEQWEWAKLGARLSQTGIFIDHRGRQQRLQLSTRVENYVKILKAAFSAAYKYPDKDDFDYLIVDDLTIIMEFEESQRDMDNLNARPTPIAEGNMQEDVTPGDVPPDPEPATRDGQTAVLQQANEERQRGLRPQRDLERAIERIEQQQPPAATG